MLHNQLPTFLARQTFRRFRRERGFVTTVLLTLGLCLGANIAIFAVVDAVLLRALPFPEPDRLVMVYNAYPGAGVERAGASIPNYFERREDLKAFSGLALYQDGSAIVGEEGAPRRVSQARVTPEFFEVLGVPLRGRTFTDEELTWENSSVAILTHGFWQSEFAGDPDVLGKKFIVNGYENEVIAVLPKGFRYLSEDAQFYTPAGSNAEDRTPRNRHSNNYGMIARLGPGVTLAEAQAEIDAFNEQQITTDPYAGLLRDAGYHTTVKGLHADTVEGVRTILLLLQAGVFSLLLIGGVNLVNLLLIRASGRAKEIAVRQALGAGRFHVMREVAAETVALAIVGGLFGCLLGFFGVRLLNVLGASELPLGTSIVFDLRIAAVALAGALVVGLALAVPVIWFSLHRDLGNVLNSESRTGTATRAAHRLRHGFIVVQIAGTFVLLIGAGLLGMSLRKALAVDPGFQAENLLTANISLPYKTYPEDEKRQAFVQRLITAYENIPGVTAIGTSTMMPFGNNNNNNATAVEGVERAAGESIRTHHYAAVAGDYFSALGVTLIEGRLLEEADQHREQRVCVVDAEVAQRYWPGESALGHRLTNGPEFNEEEAFTIVGVVRTVKQFDLSSAVDFGTIYVPYRDMSWMSFSVVVRSTLDPARLGPSLRESLLGIDGNLPLDDVRMMATRIDDSLAMKRSPALLAAIFAGVALLLAAIGTYGVLAYAVNQRRREIGVRMALGALPQQVRTLFLGMGGKLLVVGAVLGVVAGWFMEKGMQSVLYEIERLPLSLLGLVTALMLAVVFMASLIPSHRAARLSPMEALRDDL